MYSSELSVFSIVIVSYSLTIGKTAQITKGANSLRIVSHKPPNPLLSEPLTKKDMNLDPPPKRQVFLRSLIYSQHSKTKHKELTVLVYKDIPKLNNKHQ